MQGTKVPCGKTMNKKLALEKQCEIAKREAAGGEWDF